MNDDERAQEAVLLAACRSGDAGAFDQLVRIHQNRVFMTACQILRNRDDALDVAQDTFLRAWKSVDSFDGKASFGSWISRIATNASIDLLRRRQVRPQADLDDGDLAINAASRTTPASAPAPGARMDREFLRGRFDAALSTLSPDHRAVLILKEVEDLSYQEIAHAVGCSMGTVMSRLFYARKKMQSELKDIYEQLG